MCGRSRPLEAVHGEEHVEHARLEPFEGMVSRARRFVVSEN
jgi:hypothetical protein